MSVTFNPFKRDFWRGLRAAAHYIRTGDDTVFDPKDDYNNNSGENDMAKIVTIDGENFRLYNKDELVGIYSRRRDAVRGANRRGLVLA